MPADHPASSYFDSPTQPSQQNQVVNELIAMLDDLASIEGRSTAAFLSYRQIILRSRESSAISREASIASADSGPFSGAYSSSSGMDNRPMPTVARAIGGGEWEAGLSRRVAAHLQRREKEDKRSRRGVGGQGRGRRRRLDEERGKSKCPPLFPVPVRPAFGRGIDGRWSSSLFGNLQDVWAKLYGWRMPLPRHRLKDQIPGSIRLPHPSHAGEDEPEKKGNGRASWKWKFVSVSLAVLAVGVGLWVSSVKVEVSAVVRW